MGRILRRILLAFGLAAALGPAGGASAAPVVVSPILSIRILGVAPLTFGSVGTIDVTGSTVTFPAGVISLAGTIAVPVTGTTAIHSISLASVANLTGTFSLGGVTAQAPGEICAGGPFAGEACNVGGSIGGVMGLTGTLYLNLIPGIVVVPINLGDMRVGQGGATNVPFTADAAAWTTGVGLVNTGVGTWATTASDGPNVILQLVSPTFVNRVGFLLPIFTTLTISNPALPVPEVSPIVPLALGVAVLLRARRR